MINPRLISTAPLIRIQTVALLACVSILNYGCSNSGDAEMPSPDLTPEIDNNPTVGPTVPSDDDGAADDNPGTEEPESPDIGEVSVNLDITVPKYQSNSLQVNINWGDYISSAAWVVDESWAATAQLPSNTTHLLVVTFSDKNGQITLGTFEQDLTTTEADSFYMIQANQFDTSRWDTDGDGVSNLSESIAGTDPAVDESLLTEIRDTLDFQGRRTMTEILNRSSDYESSIPDERPYFDHEEVIIPHEWPDWGTLYDTTRVTIDIDEVGTGTYQYYDQVQHDPSDSTTITKQGTRINTGESVIWMASYSRYQRRSAVSTTREIIIETSVIDEQHRIQTGTLDVFDGIGSSYTVNASYSLIGETVADTPFCKATEGSITHDVFTHDNLVGVQEISKSPGDTYWRVRTNDHAGQLLEEYFIRKFGEQISLGYFFCDFADLK